MVSEINLQDVESQWFSIRGGVLKQRFESRNIPVELIDDNEGVYNYISEFVASHKDINTIAFSDGVTLYQLDLFDWARQQFRDKEIIQPLRRTPNGHYFVFGEQPEGKLNLPKEEFDEKMAEWYEGCRKSLLSDLLIISANAITLHGEIVSVDGLGNRVSGMIFGPRHVLVIVGRNKIVTDVEAAQNRIRNKVAPMTFIRHNLKHHTNFVDLPCLKVGRCMDCSQPQSACRDWVIIRGQNNRHKDRIHLLVVNKDLGF